jgi:L-glyceraldehyde 3-phosphate reductase
VRGKYFPTDSLTEQNLAHVCALNELAQERGQTLAQMAIAWVLRDPLVTSALIGARTVKQLEDSLAAVRNLQFSADELATIDRYATDAGIDIWTSSRIKEVE